MAEKKEKQKKKAKKTTISISIKDLKWGRIGHTLCKDEANITRHAHDWNPQVSQLVSWCIEPSHPQRITSELNTNFSLSPSYSFYKSLYHKFFFFSNNSSNSIRNFGTQNQKTKRNKTTTTTKNNKTCFGTCLYSVGTQHGNLHPAG